MLESAGLLNIEADGVEDPNTEAPCGGAAVNRLPAGLNEVLLAWPPNMEDDELVPPKMDSPGFGDPPKIEVEDDWGFTVSGSVSSSSLTSGSSSSLSGSSLSSVSPIISLFPMSESFWRICFNPEAPN